MPTVVKPKRFETDVKKLAGVSNMQPKKVAKLMEGVLGSVKITYDNLYRLCRLAAVCEEPAEYLQRLHDHLVKERPCFQVSKRQVDDMVFHVLEYKLTEHRGLPVPLDVITDLGLFEDIGEYGDGPEDRPYSGSGPSPSWDNAVRLLEN